MSFIRLWAAVSWSSNQSLWCDLQKLQQWKIGDACIVYIFFLIIVTKILTLYKISTNWHLSVFNSIVLIWSLFLCVVFTFIWTILCAHFSLVVENLVNRHVHPEPWWFSRTNFCGIASKDPGCCSGILALTTSLSVVCLDTQTMSRHTVWDTTLTAFS